MVVMVVVLVYTVLDGFLTGVSFPFSLAHESIFLPGTSHSSCSSSASRFMENSLAAGGLFGYGGSLGGV